MPSRVIRGEILSSDSLSRVSLEAEALFFRLLIAADDFGRLDARLPLLKAALFPVREIQARKIDAWLSELATADGKSGPIVRYQVNGRPYVQLRAWEKHRSDSKRSAKSRFPAPPGIEDQELVGGVYFIEREPGGPIKIGYSAHIPGRVIQLKTAIPKCSVLGFIADADRSAEKRLHRRFADLSDGGEWFRRDDSLLAWIKDNAAEYVESGTGGQSGQNQELPGQDGQPSYGSGVGGGVGDCVSGSDAGTSDLAPDAVLFATHFRAELIRVHSGFKPPGERAFATWCRQAGLLLSERGIEYARETARWLFNDATPDPDAEFWRSVILSVPKFREKFEQLAAKRRARSANGASATPGRSTSDLAERARAHVRAQQQRLAVVPPAANADG